MKQQGQSLDGDNLQEVLDAGDNASRVGRQQFFTPQPLAEALMLALPRRNGLAIANTFADLTMGAGSLLLASGADKLYGIDIDSRLARKPDNAAGMWSCVNADLTEFYPLLQEANWTLDLCGLNPPFSVRWHSERIVPQLSMSKVPAIIRTLETTPNLGAGGTIDSTLATFLIALDRMTEKGEGYMICSQSTAERIFGAPHEAAACAARSHIWLWLTLSDGGDWQATDHGDSTIFENARAFDVAVLYFARGHTGEHPFHLVAPDTQPDTVRRTLAPIPLQRNVLRRGFSIHSIYDFAPDSDTRWRAAKEEWLRRREEARSNRPSWNMWLERGKIRRHLTPFQAVSGKIPRAKVEALNRLEGQSPMALVVQRSTRMELLQAVHSNIWRVEPALIADVEEAIRQYNGNRAPFYQLNDVQRLGWLDEHDTILCLRDGLAGFTKGESYEIKSETIEVERHTDKVNLLGKPEKVTLSGRELCFTITGDNGRIAKFSPPIKVGAPPKDMAHHTPPRRNAITDKCDRYDLDILVKFFRIPEVPDVAQIAPDIFERHVAKIHEIETEMNRRLAA